MAWIEDTEMTITVEYEGQITGFVIHALAPHGDGVKVNGIGPNGPVEFFLPLAIITAAHGFDAVMRSYKPMDEKYQPRDQECGTDNCNAMLWADRLASDKGSA